LRRRLTRLAAVIRHGDRVRDRLAGRSILLSGASGFLGKAVLACLLRHAYEPSGVHLLLRAGSEDEAEERLRGEVLGADAFAGLDGAALRARIDDGRLSAIVGDLREDGVAAPGALAGIDIVIHCAATVSFEEPLDDALQLNSLGPARLREALARDGSLPHFVHVSTAYVADRRRGEVPEDGVPHQALPELDLAGLLELGDRWREEAEREAREERRARRFVRAAGRDAARRPGLDPVARAEELRRRWIAARLSARGRAKAQELGWGDTYALSKALGERRILETPGALTIVRPTIIESALEQPYPGWLEGIKVADPLILAYAARGLTHLPGRRANRIDIVTVDQVANACVAAAAYPPESGRRALAVASTARNPLAIGELADQIRTYFAAHPLLRPGGSPIAIGELRFVPTAEALRPARRRQRLAAALAGAATASPVRLGFERTLRGNRSMAERITRMVEIYGAYTALDCVFDDSNTCRLFSRLSEDDRRDLPFDTAAIDWDDYLQRVHLPAVHRLSGANRGEAAAG
jgi:nucleoside-diphosphate-sugar epimerase